MHQSLLLTFKITAVSTSCDKNIQFEICKIAKHNLPRHIFNFKYEFKYIELVTQSRYTKQILEGH